MYITAEEVEDIHTMLDMDWSIKELARVLGVRVLDIEWVLNKEREILASLL